MPWSKPDFVEIGLSMEVTGYVNTDDSIGPPVDAPPRREEPGAMPVGEHLT